MNELSIGREDVQKVADDLNLLISEEQINQVLERYPSAEEEDPVGTWDLIVEQILNELEIPKAKYFFREVKIRDGEREYFSSNFFTAESSEKAKEQADYDVLNFYQENQPQEDGGAYHCHGEVHVSLYKLEEVSKLEYDILRKYL